MLIHAASCPGGGQLSKVLSPGRYLYCCVYVVTYTVGVRRAVWPLCGAVQRSRGRVANAMSYKTRAFQPFQGHPGKNETSRDTYGWNTPLSTQQNPVSLQRVSCHHILTSSSRYMRALASVTNAMPCSAFARVAGIITSHHACSVSSHQIVRYNNA